MRQDIRDAVRALRGAPLHTFAAILVLTLGIGASTAIFSVVDAVVLRALPYDEHDRLVAVGERRDGRTTGLNSVAPQNFRDWERQQQVFESIAAIASASLTLREPGSEPEELRAQRVSPAFFTVLRAPLALGRPFSPEEEVEGRHRVAVLSHAFWQERFGGDPNVIGRTLPIDGTAYEVVGVASRDFMYPAGAVRPTQLWVALAFTAAEEVRNPSMRSYYLSVIARLRPGVAVEQASAQMDQVAAALERAHPDWNRGSRIAVLPLHQHLVGAQTRRWMWLLLGAVLLVLLIACANVASLLIARASAREREFGIRAALGAGRGRLAGQLLIESLLLGGAGLAGGVLLAWSGVGLLRTSIPDGIPRVAAIGLDARVLTAAALMTLVTALGFGLFPAVQSSRPDLASSLRDGARGATAGRTRQRLRSALVVVEVALATILLVGAGLFIGSFMTVLGNEPGMETRNILTATVRLRGPDAQERGARVLTELVARARALPGVTHAAAIAGGMPLTGSMTSTTLRLPGQPLPEAESINTRAVTPDYHATLGIPLRGGRSLAEADHGDAPGVVVLNEAAVRRFFDGQNPVGRMVTLRGDRQVVGVVADIRQQGPETEAFAEAYVPIVQSPPAAADILVRTSGPPHAVLPQLKAALYSLEPDVPLRNVTTLDALLAGRLAPRRFNMLVLSLFGGVALLIAAVGLYGLMSYVVSQRTHEIGVRMALGATTGRVIGLVMGRAALLIGAGLAAGTLGAWGLVRAAEVGTFLFRFEATNPMVFALAVAVLAAAGLAASAIPARRAAGIDPMTALRE